MQYRLSILGKVLYNLPNHEIGQVQQNYIAKWIIKMDIYNLVQAVSEVTSKRYKLVAQTLIIPIPTAFLPVSQNICKSSLEVP